ncbi:MAG: bifunctional methionine sulfoxide reductase B/A protein [Bacteroidales bacterium]|jgi:peptide methionine sulfoxide reductase msrA/msrB|nr:bifunctional methionine sulfoxide reductase B/A protein [Bacteroidales bacterium]HHT52103.1 bifunctional methionine sulfoxide reductase B/A protein [Bacteroidales bacterium]
MQTIIILLSILGNSNEEQEFSKIDTNQLGKKDFKNLTEEEWKARLTPEQYYVLREKGTDPPHVGKYDRHYEKGTYHCAACGEPLFTDEMKFDSGSGWPSFDRELSGKIQKVADYSHNMMRVEILCPHCGSHLGHLFDDGKTETGMRYCVNSTSLSFQPATDTILLGAGCFWCVEAMFKKLKGVISVESGYSGGEMENPSYRDVCSGETGHAEVVKVVYDPAVLSVEQLLEIFFAVHNPTTLNRQGPDVGTQYRSAIYYSNEAQLEAIQQVMSRIEEAQLFKDPIVTEVAPIKNFYKAEDYHTDYFELHGNEPYCQMVIRPKMTRFKEKFRSLFKDK